MLHDFEAIDTDVIMISADPPDALAKLRERCGLDFALLSDEDHVAATHFDVPISYRSPRYQVYPNGFHQPAVFAFVGDELVFDWVQRPRWWNLGGAAWRPSPKRVLKLMQRAVRRRAA